MDGKSSQSYPVNTGVPRGSILGFTHFLLHINDLPDDVICIIAVYADDTTLYSKCDQTSDLWQKNLESASELESDLRGTVDLDRKLLVDLSSGKTELVSFDRSNNIGATDAKMGLFLRENHLIAKKLGLPFYSRLDCGSSIVSIAKAVSKKMEP